jgi:protein arginine kinase activator
MSETPKEDLETCEDCRKAPATVHIRRIAAGEEVEVRLCVECARERGVEPKLAEGSVSIDPMALMFKNLGEMEETQATCPGCGMSYSTFKETGRLGCAHCYESFQGELKPLIRRVHGEVRHVGKVPVREGERYDHAARLRRLNEDLEKAIVNEEYERAAEIRDRIQEVEETAAGEPDR